MNGPLATGDGEHWSRDAGLATCLLWILYVYSRLVRQPGALCYAQAEQEAIQARGETAYSKWLCRGAAQALDAYGRRARQVKGFSCVNLEIAKLY